VFTDASKNLVSNAITGTGNVVMSTSPTLVTPALGTPSALVGTNITGTATAFNINGTVGATTPTTGAFTAITGGGRLQLTALGSPPASGSGLELGGGSSPIIFSYNRTGSAYLPLDLTASAFGWSISGTSIGTFSNTGINGMAIGATTPAAGAFTTLSASSSVTLSGGTANGVAYLNGSKVLTTGSALTFDGTTLANINSDGTGFSTQSAASNFSILRLGTDSVNGYAFFQSGKSGTGTTLPFVWRQDSSELMRLTSSGLEVKQSQLIGYSSYAGIGTNGLAVAGNLGIGTSSPLSPLDVVVGAGGARRILLNYDDSLITIKGASNTANPETLRLVADNIRFNTGITGSGTEHMRLDTSGNLGLGVTPSAWFSTIRALQIGSVGGASIAGNTSAGGSATIGLNVYFDAAAATARYGASSFASRYSQLNGAHEWFTSTDPTPTAGNAISFSQVMTVSSDGTFRVKGAGVAGSTDAFQVSGSAPADAARIDSSGRLLVGTSSAITTLTVRPPEDGGIALQRPGSTGTHLLISTTAGGVSPNYTTTYNTLNNDMRFSTAENSGTGGTISFLTGTSGTATERARITSTGNVVAGGSVALATTATDGFLYVPTCAGTPTGTPTAITGMAPIVVNTTNNKLYFYSGGAWRDAGP
jgi:hypothetical protein